MLVDDEGHCGDGWNWAWRSNWELRDFEGWKTRRRVKCCAMNSEWGRLGALLLFPAAAGLCSRKKPGSRLVRPVTLQCASMLAFIDGH